MAGPSDLGRRSDLFASVEGGARSLVPDTRARLYQEIVDNAQAATGARLVNLAWLDRATRTVHTGIMSGLGSSPVQQALAAARRIMPDFDPTRVVTDLDAVAANRLVFLEGKEVTGPTEDVAAGAVHPAILLLARTVAGVRYSFVCPLAVAGEVVGSLAFHTARPLTAAQRHACIAFARQAALTLENARLLEDARRAQAETERVRGELEAVLDSADDAITVYAPDGRLLHANRRARERLIALAGELPPTLADFRARVTPLTPDGTPLDSSILREAFRGEHVTAELLLPEPHETRRVHVKATPVRDEHGAARAVVFVSRDVTELHDAIAARARLDGAVKTARLAVDRLGNRLSALITNAEVLATMVDGVGRERADRIVANAWRTAATVDQLRRIVRFAQTEEAGEVVLDLDAATTVADPKPD